MLVNGQPTIRDKPQVLYGSQLSFVTDSDATCSDNDGPGRTVGKGISWGAKYVERLATWVATRAGRSPTTPMRKIRRMLVEDPTAPIQCQFCGHRYTPLPGFLPSLPPPEDTVYAPPQRPSWWIPSTSAILKTGSRAPVCSSCRSARKSDDPRILRDKTARKALKELVSRINSSSWSTRHLAVHYITALAASSPDIQRLLLDLGADKELQRLYHSAYDRMGELDHLLAPSRRALAVIVDTEVLSLAQEWKALFGCRVSYDENGVPMRFRHQERIADTLFGMIDDPDRQVLVLHVIHRSGMYHPRHASPARTLYAALWVDMATSRDPVYSAILMPLLWEIYSTYKGGLCQNWSNELLGTVMFCKEHSDLIDQLPTAARELLEGVRDIGEWGADQGLETHDWWKRAVWRYDDEDPEGEPFGGSDSSCYSSYSSDEEETEPDVSAADEHRIYEVECYTAGMNWCM